jgi:glycosyltransferase involved in cell wall biosynthesis
MRLLFVNQYYHPEHAATAQVLTDLCEHLSRRGHAVHVLCSRGRYDPGANTTGRPARRETVAGVRVKRIAATGFAKRGRLGRLADYASFHVLTGAHVLATGWRYDAVITLTTPPLIGLSAAALRRLGLTRHLVWSMDLHPECEFALGLLRPSSLPGRALAGLSALEQRSADACVAIGPCMRHRLAEKGVAPEKLHVIPIWGHDAPATDVQVAALKRRWDLDGRFVVMYSGNAGLMHTFDAVCEAARILRDDERFAFVFVGGGRRIGEIARWGESHGLSRLGIRAYVPRAHLGASLRVGDVHLITMRQEAVGTVVPSKLAGVMAVGRPVVYVGPDRGAAAEAIRQAGCGFVVSPREPGALVQRLRQLADDPGLRDRFGRAGRAAFERAYSPEVNCAAWAELIESVVGRRRSPS